MPDGHETPRRWTSRISRTRQVTIPIDALREAGLAPDDRIEIIAGGDGSVVIRRASNPYDEFAGALTGAYPPGYLASL